MSTISMEVFLEDLELPPPVLGYRDRKSVPLPSMEYFGEVQAAISG
jgi:hypothetical protein